MQPVSIPADAVELRVVVESDTDPDGFDLVLEESHDGGVTWFDSVRWSFNGPTSPRFGSVRGAHEHPLSAGPGHMARARVDQRESLPGEVRLSLVVT